MIKQGDVESRDLGHCVQGATVPRCGWKVERVEVDKSGRCEAAGGSLRRVELEEAEWWVVCSWNLLPCTL